MKHKNYKPFTMAFDAGKQTSTRKLKTVSSNPNADIEVDISALKNSSRHLSQNDPLYIAVLEAKVTNVIGEGITPIPAVKNMDGTEATELNKRIDELHTEWAKRPDVTGVHSLDEAQRLIALSTYRDGDSAVVFHGANTTDLDFETKIPFAIEVIDADRIPNSLTNQKDSILQGIKINSFGKPKAYAVIKPQLFDAGFSIEVDYTLVEENNCVFFASRQRAGQLRGVPLLTSSLVRFDDLDQFDRNERTAADISSALALFITRGTNVEDPSFFERLLDDNETQATNPDGSPKFDSEGEPVFEEKDELPPFAPGTMSELLPGENVIAHQSDRPGSTLKLYRELVLRSVAASVGVGYSQISGEYTGTYSATKAEANSIFVATRKAQKEFVADVVEPIYKRFILAAHAAGELGDLSGVDIQTLDRVTFISPQMPMLDLAAEGSSYINLINANLMSRQTAQKKLGLDPNRQNELIQSDRETLKSIGISPDLPLENNAGNDFRYDQVSGEDGGQDKVDGNSNLTKPLK